MDRRSKGLVGTVPGSTWRAPFGLEPKSGEDGVGNLLTLEATAGELGVRQPRQRAVAVRENSRFGQAVQEVRNPMADPLDQAAGGSGVVEFDRGHFSLPFFLKHWMRRI